MCFLIAMDEDPLRSLSSEIALTIPALYDIFGRDMFADLLV